MSQTRLNLFTSSFTHFVAARPKFIRRLGGYIAFLFCLYVSAVSAETAPLPQNCTDSCVTPYSEIIGSTADGVQSYSNCQSSCVVFEPNKLNGVYTGIKWQCVEFTRRWLIQNRGLTYGDVDVAADIWTLKELTRLSDQSPVPLTRFENGARRIPLRGDLIVYGREFLGTGHSAIVLQVDGKAGLIRVGEQNFKNQKWPGNYSRAIPLIHQHGRYWLLDAYILGWMRAPN